MKFGVKPVDMVKFFNYNTVAQNLANLLGIGSAHMSSVYPQSHSQSSSSSGTGRKKRQTNDLEYVEILIGRHFSLNL